MLFLKIFRKKGIIAWCQDFVNLNSISGYRATFLLFLDFLYNKSGKHSSLKTTAFMAKKKTKKTRPTWNFELRNTIVGWVLFFL